MLNSSTVVQYWEGGDTASLSLLLMLLRAVLVWWCSRLLVDIEGVLGDCGGPLLVVFLTCGMSIIIKNVRSDDINFLHPSMCEIFEVFEWGGSFKPRV